MWLILAANWLLWRVDPFYRRFHPPHGHRRQPVWSRQRELLRLGVPSGATTLIEVSSFTLITMLLARFGATVVAGHQIIANLIALLFMLPLSYGIASSVLVAQALGAGEPATAQRAGVRGYGLSMFTALAIVTVLYLLREPLVGLFTRDAAVAEVALGLIGLGLLFHLFDAIQGVATFILRGYKVALAPMLIQGVSLWSIGLGGGFLLAYLPPAGWTIGPAASFWLAGAFGTAIAALALSWLAEFVARNRIRESSQRKGRAHGPA
jgi:MATE family multidrug resistance protein